MNASNISRSLAGLVVLAISVASVARDNQNLHSPPQQQQAFIKAAGCVAAAGINELDLNNVRARVETGGSLWQNRSLGQSAYEVPKTPDRSGARSIFSGGLWLGGKDPAQNLKIAAVLFRQQGKNDYWPGPLDTTGQAAISPATCVQYDKTWKTHRSDVERHLAYFNCLANPGECDVDEEFPNGWVIPTAFLEWPALGDVSPGVAQAFYLAPFGEFNSPDGDYNPEQGDYPGYDLFQTNDCKNRFRENPVPLYGDQNIWWVFNDKGDAHTESNGAAIGMEIRAQAFAFSTNDEVNNMTFYNYVLFNRGTLTLLNTFFGQYVDPDLGNAADDYVGCDVQRGLGYCYNGDNNDETTDNGVGYTVQPPAVGVDFFEGPFQDTDGRDNVLNTTDCAAAVADTGIVYPGIGMGYGDTVPDNERYGMRAFLYFTNPTVGSGSAAPPATTDPDVAQHFYNLMTGIWKDNTPMSYGGDGYEPSNPAAVQTSYMFPGDSDPLGWSTSCAPQAGLWTEETAGNPPGDRRFIQSSGPFKLEPGAYNNITVGVVWARATSGGPFASVQEVRSADDKAQALFDNCFRVLDGPDAPVVQIQELDRELILYLTYPEFGTNNRNDAYAELDPTIPATSILTEIQTIDSTVITLDGDTVVIPVDVTTETEVENDRFYRFQGYQIYQVKDATVGPDQLDDINVARPVGQVDKEDGITRIINWPLDPTVALPVPTEMVNGGDTGIVHSFRVTQDMFAQGANTRLVNFKTYHYIAIAYGHNNFRPYNAATRTGQAFPYKPGRRTAGGSSIRSYSGIPHKPAPESGGTIANVQYGQGFKITRLEGQGNGGLVLSLEQSTVDAIVDAPPFRQEQLSYQLGLGPLDVRVVDPLKVPNAKFEFWLRDTTELPLPTSTPNQGVTYPRLDDAYWMLVRLADDPSQQDTVFSGHALLLGTEKLILDWGLAVNVHQAPYDPPVVASASDNIQQPKLLTATMEPAQSWFVGIPDIDGENLQNWIRSGRIKRENGIVFPDYPRRDTLEVFEDILGGTWAPWLLVGDTIMQPMVKGGIVPAPAHTAQQGSRLSDLPSVLVVMTPNKSKWTRCVVMEAHYNEDLTTPSGVGKLEHRPVPSVDKNGIPLGSPGCNTEEASRTNVEGMGWFPGYAIDLETGERLNMSFSEDSFLGGAIGRDMLWNPSSVLDVNGSPVFGGGHWIYVFANRRRSNVESPAQMPQYDEGRFMRDNMEAATLVRLQVWRSVAWVGSALVREGMSMLSPQEGLVPSEVRIRINVAKPYNIFTNPFAAYEPSIGHPRNQGLPLYTFDTGDAFTETDVHEVAESSLDLIGVVPNPYYGYSGYETSRLDNRVKFINLPQRCTISIYNVSGTLIRKFRKDNELTYLDWDLKNAYNAPIAGGTYICHIDVPGVGERVLKWFGVLRPLDLQNF